MDMLERNLFHFVAQKFFSIYSSVVIAGVCTISLSHSKLVDSLDLNA